MTSLNDLSVSPEGESAPPNGPPYQIYGDLHAFFFWTPQSKASQLLEHAYSPLEAASDFASDKMGHPVGGWGMFLLNRYHKSPFGPYDELVVIPGNFAWTHITTSGSLKKGQNMRMTRIYVSEKEPCYNGRNSWTLPKHLAKFVWDEQKDGSSTVQVFPNDITGDEREASASPVPLFRATIKPIRHIPSFPLSFSWLKCLGIDTTMVQPPLPHGMGSLGELPGNDLWCSFAPLLSSKRAELIRAEIHPLDDETENGRGENLWLGLGRRHIGVKLGNGVVHLNAPLGRW